MPHNYPGLFAALRAKNPNIRIFVYVPVQHVTTGLKKNNPKTTLTAQLNAGVSSKWYLKDSAGQNISIWKDTEIMDITSPWKDYLAKFVATKILPSAKWDGVFFDGIEEKASWFSSDIDLNHDHRTDDADQVDWQWKNSTVAFLKTARQLLGNTLILANSPQEYYAPYLNGILFENFGNWHSYAWAENFARYQAAVQNTLPPHIVIINGGVGTGKSIIAKRLVYNSQFKNKIVYDHRDEYPDEIYTRFLKPQREVFKKHMATFKSSIIVVEEATVVLQAYTETNTYDLITGIQHNNNVGIFLFHSARKIPQSFLDLSNYFVFTHPFDRDDLIIERFEDHWEKILAEKNRVIKIVGEKNYNTEYFKTSKLKYDFYLKAR